MESNQQVVQFYEKKGPIVPRTAKGVFRTFKTSVLVLAYSVYFLLPWLPWKRLSGIQQAVVFDLNDGQFYLFNLVAYPKDVFWLALLLFIAAIFLFFATSLIGRAFCGYFCFQTLWTDLYMFVERWVQGERPARLRLIKQSWDSEKIYKIGLTHTIWLLIAFWTGLTFVLYFGYAPTLIVSFFKGQANLAAYVAVLSIALSTYAAAGFMRENICAYVCPYGRFQSVMYDPQTLAVAYDYKRGEGNSGRVGLKNDLKLRDERLSAGHGDCIDCGICVQVCPTGIDIRDGLQYRCISCGLCIDACNDVMKSVGFPQGLIRYDAEANIDAGSPTPPHISWRRYKVYAYFVILVAMVTMLTRSVMHQSDMECNVEQIRQPLYVVMSNGDIRNRYEIRLENEADGDAIFTISTKGLPPNALNVGEMKNILIHSDESVLVDVGVLLSPDQVNMYHHFNFVIKSSAHPGDVVEIPSNFSSEKSAV